MLLQKQKNTIRNFSARFGKRLLVWHSVVLASPLLFSVVAFGLVMSAHPAPTHEQAITQVVAHKKSSTNSVPAPSTVPKPVVPVPPPVAPTPAPSVPAPVAPVKAPVQAGTPKPEPVVTPAPSSNVSGLTPTTPAPTPSPQAQAPASTPSSQVATGYTSTNWSGYLAATGNFTAISGSWTATSPTGNGLTTSADSTWIGIGGVTSGDLIQVGTQNIITASGQVSASAFYELLPAYSQAVPAITVSPGDSMTAALSEVSSGQWTISITDNTDGQSFTVTVSYASLLSSAEWIEEDPSYSFRRQIPFDTFHEASFSAGSTVANGLTVTITTSTAQPVTMVDNHGQIIAVPSVIGSDGASFTVTH